MTVVSDIDSAKADYHALKAAFANIGLDMQPAKYKLYMPLLYIIRPLSTLL